MAHIHAFKIRIGFRIDDSTCERILSQGLAVNPDIYTDPVYVDRVLKTPTETIFTVHALSRISVVNWKNALMQDLGSIEEYEVPVSPTADPPDPPLDVWSRVGNWTKSIGSATTTVSSLPSQPKGIFVWGSGFSGGSFGTFQNHGGVVFGYSNGTENRDFAYVTQHDAVTSNANRSISKKAFHLLDPTGTDTTHHKENCTISFGSTSFSMNWSATTLATVGNYFVFGGDDIGNVTVADYEVGTTTSGIVEYALGERYDFGIMLYPFKSGGLPWPTATTGSTGALHSISAHAGPNPYRSWTTSCASEDNVNPCENHCLQRRLYMLSGMSETSHDEEQYCNFNEWTDTGFKLEWFNAPTAANYIFSGMFVQGGLWDCGFYYQPVEPGQVYALLNSKYPTVQGVMGFSIGKGELTNTSHGQGHSTMIIGAADNQDHECCLTYHGHTSSSPTVEKTLMSNNTFMKYVGDELEAGEGHTH